MQVFCDPQAFLKVIGMRYSSAIQEQLRLQLTEAFGDCLQATQHFWQESGTQAAWLPAGTLISDCPQSLALFSCIHRQDPEWRQVLTPSLRLSLWVFNDVGGGLYLLEEVQL